MHLRVADLAASRAFSATVREPLGVPPSTPRAFAAGHRDDGGAGEGAYGRYAAYVLDPDGTNVEAVARGAEA